ncbi:uncharacterized protein LY79DRAFT_642954 [Colletotrichum navitas]|uniref:Tyrosinase copper-binding domain-containing protein n=1 Tax=Colletotrichum navitas TaxID=681940 RepID=A0AAD8PLZ0_9PEZI|nr:uncharacterized protein LY79DRAFT_642954 [Colletotrichum navitas]KAK1570066.1 hypothetical protein LY79DRAFT_642954 [Colletotrichum navitas]
MNTKYRYLLSSDLELSNLDTSSDDNLDIISSTERRWRQFSCLFGTSFVIFISLIAIFALGRHLGYEDATSKPNRCIDPSFRSEWRTLSRQEKLDYIEAVKCLTRMTSVLTGNGTIHDDFAFVHNKHGHSAHGKAPFLPWHRRFIFIYEKYLQDKCSYKGALPYWDWTLDWENFPESPIFSSVTGFGGNGNQSAPHSVGEGHCVTDGPFADWRPLYYGSNSQPHCLSRGITDFAGTSVSLKVVQDILRERDYETFFLALERGPHDMAPNGIRGEFFNFTAPNDPIFYLHHAQLDRLWFIWQKRDEKTRLTNYSGSSDENASLNDILNMEGLEEENVRVSQVMGTQGGGLCYQYSLT